MWMMGPYMILLQALLAKYPKMPNLGFWVGMHQLGLFLLVGVMVWISLGDWKLMHELVIAKNKLKEWLFGNYQSIFVFSTIVPLGPAAVDLGFGIVITRGVKASFGEFLLSYHVCSVAYDGWCSTMIIIVRSDEL